MYPPPPRYLPYPPPPYYGRPPYGGGPGWPYPYGPYSYPPPRASGAQVHDGGFLHLQFGLHGSTLAGESGSAHVEYSGSGGSFGVAAGYALVPDFILFVEAMIAGSADADVTVNGGRSISTKYGTDLMGIGPGASVYFGPNFFASAAVLMAAVTVDDDGSTVVDSSSGVALDAALGKEWWVSDNWGLGVSAQMLLAKVKGKDPDVSLGLVPDWTFVGFSLLFSATYN